MNKTFKKLIDEAQTIAIATHLSPDGDAIGSSLGLALTLEELGKTVYLIKNDDLPSNLSFLPYLDKYSWPSEEYLSIDLFITTDIAAKSRTGKGEIFFEKARKSLCIDHHRTNPGFADYNIINAQASSTCEMITYLLLENSYHIPEDAATFLYLGMLTDTNRFQYSSSNSNTLRLAAELLDKGADKDFIHKNLYESLNKSYLLLEGEILSKAEFFCKDKLVVAVLSQELLEKYGLDQSQTEGLVAVLKSIDGVEVSCLIKENARQEQKISLRSKEYINVSEIAEEFGGGGHIRAAGFPLELTKEEAKEVMIKRLGDLCNEGCIDCK